MKNDEFETYLFIEDQERIDINPLHEKRLAILSNRYIGSASRASYLSLKPSSRTSCCSKGSNSCVCSLIIRISAHCLLLRSSLSALIWFSIAVICSLFCRSFVLWRWRIMLIASRTTCDDDETDIRRSAGIQSYTDTRSVFIAQS